MELNFNKTNQNVYEAVFEALGDFNLHVERVKNGTLEVYQRGVAEGEYDFAWSAGIGARKVIDYDFAAFVYPKWIKVVSSSEVINASVNFNEGGGSGNDKNGDIMQYYYIDRTVESSNNNTLLYAAIGRAALANSISLGNNGTIIGASVEAKDYTVAIAATNLPFYGYKNEFIDTGDFIQNITLCQQNAGYNHDFSFLIPITKEEFYSFDFKYPEYSGGE